MRLASAQAQGVRASTRAEVRRDARWEGEGEGSIFRPPQERPVAARGLVLRNVASIVPTPGWATGRGSLGPSQARVLLEAAHGHPLEATCSVRRAGWGAAGARMERCRLRPGGSARQQRLQPDLWQVQLGRPRPPPRGGSCACPPPLRTPCSSNAPGYVKGPADGGDLEGSARWDADFGSGCGETFRVHGHHGSDAARGRAHPDR